MRQGPNKRGRGRGGSGPQGGGNMGGGGNHNGGGNRRPMMPNRNQSFDSNGPDVRIRGSAYQVHEKYMNLAQDATAAGDRIMAENYYQHAEHYYRIINAQEYGPDGQRRRYEGQQQGGQGYQQQQQQGDDPQPGSDGGSAGEDESEDGNSEGRDSGERVDSPRDQEHPPQQDSEEHQPY